MTCMHIYYLLDSEKVGPKIYVFLMVLNEKVRNPEEKLCLLSWFIFSINKMSVFLNAELYNVRVL